VSHKREVTFQERLIWALLFLLFANFVAWWIKGEGPDPSLVVSGLVGLIGAVWGTGEVVSAVRKKNNKPVNADDEAGGT